jgi:hypothetical protein
MFIGLIFRESRRFPLVSARVIPAGRLADIARAS